jgi:hypothetical protein
MVRKRQINPLIEPTFQLHILYLRISYHTIIILSYLGSHHYFHKDSVPASIASLHHRIRHRVVVALSPFPLLSSYTYRTIREKVEAAKVAEAAEAAGRR